MYEPCIIRFMKVKSRVSDLELQIEQHTATTRREALPNFDGETATTILADRKLQVLLLFLAGYKAVSVVERT